MLQDFMDLKVPPNMEITIRYPARVSPTDFDKLYLSVYQIDDIRLTKKVQYMLTYDMCRSSEVTLQHFVDYLVKQLNDFKPGA